MVTPKELREGKNTYSKKEITRAMLEVSEIAKTSESLKAQNVNIYIVKSLIFDIP